jgi:hypothetical protein
MDKIRKLGNFKFYTLSSEPFRVYFNDCSLLQSFLSVFAMKYFPVILPTKYLVWTYTEDSIDVIIISITVIRMNFRPIKYLSSVVENHGSHDTRGSENNRYQYNMKTTLKKTTAFWKCVGKQNGSCSAETERQEERGTCPTNRWDTHNPRNQNKPPV